MASFPSDILPPFPNSNDLNNSGLLAFLKPLPGNNSYLHKIIKLQFKVFLENRNYQILPNKVYFIKKGSKKFSKVIFSQESYVICRG